LLDKQLLLCWCEESLEIHATPISRLPMNDIAAVKTVFEQWAMYDAVVRHNYMRHAELTHALAAWAELFGGPLRLVDLGCGDAGLATSGFKDANVASYFGIDLSESSIERARERTSIWPGGADLACGDLAETLHRLPDQSANVALASYALHHFAADAKRRLIKEIWRVLEPGGAFLWIDVVRDDGESRLEYIDRITDSMMHDWAGLTPAQRQLGVDHVRQSDYPESKSWILTEVEAAGFQRGNELFEDEYFGGWAFIKP
jgi:ubiquinone/menaquinone biosynthesis C-methylase UbiE